MMNVHSLHEAYREKLYIENYHLLDVVVATYLTRTLPGDPIWLIPIGASGYGKTEQIRPLFPRGTEYSDIKVLDQLTPLAFASGTGEGRIGPWLQQHPNALLLIPDLANISSMEDEEKQQLFSVMRTLFDGSIRRETGRESPEFTGLHTNLIGFSTPSIERDISMAGLMGTREIMYRLPEIQMPELMYEKDVLEEDRNDLRIAMSHFFATINAPWIEPNPDVKDRISSYATRMATWRATGNFDKEGYLIGRVEIEIPKRLYVQLKKLWKGLTKMGLNPVEIWNIFDEIEKGIGNELREKLFWRLTTDDNIPQDVEHTMLLGQLADYFKTSDEEIRKQLMVLWSLGRVKKGEINRCGVDSAWTGILWD